MSECSTEPEIDSKHSVWFRVEPEETTPHVTVRYAGTLRFSPDAARANSPTALARIDTRFHPRPAAMLGSAKGIQESL